MILCQFCLQHTENGRKKKQSEVLLSTFVVAGHTWCISGSRARNFASSVCCRHRQTTFTSGTSFGHLSQSSPKYDFKPYFEMEPISKWLPIFLVNDFYLKLETTSFYNCDHGNIFLNHDRLRYDGKNRLKFPNHTHVRLKKFGHLLSRVI